MRLQVSQVCERAALVIVHDTARRARLLRLESTAPACMHVWMPARLRVRVCIVEGLINERAAFHIYRTGAQLPKCQSPEPRPGACPIRQAWCLFRCVFPGGPGDGGPAPLSRIRTLSIPVLHSGESCKQHAAWSATSAWIWTQDARWAATSKPRARPLRVPSG